MSNNDQVRGRFINNRSDSLDNAANLPVFWTTLPQRFYLVSLAEYHTFSPNLTNETAPGVQPFQPVLHGSGHLNFPGAGRLPEYHLRQRTSA